MAQQVRLLVDFTKVPGWVSNTNIAAYNIGIRCPLLTSLNTKHVVVHIHTSKQNIDLHKNKQINKIILKNETTISINHPKCVLKGFSVPSERYLHISVQGDGRSLYVY